MVYSVSFYENSKGESPVECFINDLPKKEQTRIGAYISELKKQGYNLRRPMADYIGEGIYELRPRDNRIFYFFFLRENIMILHAIKKKTDKIPINDLELCIKRKKEMEGIWQELT